MDTDHGSSSVSTIPQIVDGTDMSQRQQEIMEKALRTDTEVLPREESTMGVDGSGTTSPDVNVTVTTES
jgi:hypothetical protein